MADETGQLFVDSFALSFHMHFHRLLKWLVAAPILACAAAVLGLRLEDARSALPSFRRMEMASP
jgi:hypothetical protein